MKKFFFSLNTVLSYKEQVLESLRQEHAQSLLKVRACEEEIERLEQQHRECVEEFEAGKRAGLPIVKMKIYENHLEGLGVRILLKQEQLEKLKEEELIKRNKMIEAKKESTSIQKLKDKKRQEYQKEEQKAQEILVEEFVSAKNAMTKLKG